METVHFGELVLELDIPGNNLAFNLNANELELLGSSKGISGLNMILLTVGNVDISSTCLLLPLPWILKA